MGKTIWRDNLDTHVLPADEALDEDRTDDASREARAAFKIAAWPADLLFSRAESASSRPVRAPSPCAHALKAFNSLT